MRQKSEYLIPDDVAQKMAIREWIDSFFPAGSHTSDADEPTDLVELAGSSMMVLTGIYTVEWPEKCPGVMCYLPSEACTSCIHDGAKPEKIREPEPEIELGSNAYIATLVKKYEHHVYKSDPDAESGFRNWRDAWCETFAFVSACRGNRARSELQISRRMGF